MIKKVTYKIEQTSSTGSPGRPMVNVNALTAEACVQILLDEYAARLAGERGPMTPEQHAQLTAMHADVERIIRADPERARRITLGFLREQGLIS